jgi:hypothetical protein
MSTTTIKQSKVTRAARIQAVVAGLKQFFGTWQKLTIGAKDYTLADLLALLQSAITADQATAADRDKLTADAEAARTTYLTVDPILRLVKMFVVSQLSDDPNAAEKLGVFMYTPRKAPTPTAAQKASAAAKAKATRAAHKAALTAPAAAAAPPATATPAPAAAPTVAKPTA